MTIEELRCFTRAQPFHPFLIHLSEGRAVPVDHPELIMVVPSGRTILVCQADETIDIIDLPQVAGVEVKLETEGLGGGSKSR
jgi:hypothetical protein